MNTVLTVQGSSVAVENKKSVLSRIFNKKNVLKAAKGILPLAVLAAVFPQAALATTTGTDLMKTGDGTEKSTFGSGSSVDEWVILAEVIVGGIMYMMTKNVKFLAGFAILSVFVTVGMSVAGYLIFLRQIFPVCRSPADVIPLVIKEGFLHDYSIIHSEC